MLYPLACPYNGLVQVGRSPYTKVTSSSSPTAGGNRLRICTVRVRITSGAPNRTMMGYSKYTKETLQPIVADSFSVREVLRKLGVQYAGGSFTHMTKVIDRLGIDRSHFYGQGWARGRKSHNRLSMDDVLVLGEPLDPAPKTYLLKRSLLEAGVEYKCQSCNNLGFWNDKDLTLQIDHVNGKKYDNRVENLRFLCPNCHSQTPTFNKRK